MSVVEQKLAKARALSDAIFAAQEAFAHKPTLTRQQRLRNLIFQREDLIKLLRPRLVYKP
jgi:hypothetical protein